MAQASSAQREPSMEEILASIRRIIEDSDGTPTVTSETVAGDRAAPAANAHGAAEASQTRAEIVEVDSFRAEFESEMDEPDTQPEDDMPAPAGLADIQAEVEARAADMDEAEEIPHASSSTGGERPAAVHEESPRQSAQSQHAMSSRIEEAPSRPNGSSDDEVAGKPDAAGDMHQDSAPAILSEVTGRRVAAAFDELSDAFDASRRKNFDDMAEEMLRPMLQDWLDNNLPTLVEKLVREEIERVARGGER